MTTTLVEGPGWADHSVDRIRGLFPLAVERYLNGVVGELAPSVTTVTNVARTYCLHSLVMADAERDGLSVEGSRLLLRRAEVVLALASIAHSDEADHPSWMPDPHGRDRLLQAWQAGPLRLDEAADFYAQDRWGFRNPYVGSEIRLGILGRDGVSVGPGYIDTEVRSGLGKSFELPINRRR